MEGDLVAVKDILYYESYMMFMPRYKRYLTLETILLPIRKFCRIRGISSNPRRLLFFHQKSLAIRNTQNTTMVLTRKMFALFGE